uniref:Uncharacterized protein n=1 Tax=Siphoviridae sp. ctXOZ1 TaxID=2823585 RepID=A0A8S5LBA2_9CAUD|nr:MAG TPA: hypothetical protein [Siphoviridae sp. ctXOZ1]
MRGSLADEPRRVTSLSFPRVSFGSTSLNRGMTRTPSIT